MQLIIPRDPLSEESEFEVKPKCFFQIYRITEKMGEKNTGDSLSYISLKKGFVRFSIRPFLFVFVLCIFPYIIKLITKICSKLLFLRSKNISLPQN